LITTLLFIIGCEGYKWVKRIYLRRNRPDTAAQVDEENEAGSQETGSTNDASSTNEKKKEMSRTTTESEKVAA